MRSLALLMAFSLLLGCRIRVCVPEPAGLTEGQRAALRDLRSAGESYRDSLLRGAPESEDAAHFRKLIRAGESFLEAEAGSVRGPAARKLLRDVCAELIDESAGFFGSPSDRGAAAARALRGYRRYVLPAHPDAGRFLR